MRALPLPKGGAGGSVVLVERDIKPCNVMAFQFYFYPGFALLSPTKPKSSTTNAAS
jgi:hypothetical protein